MSGIVEANFSNKDSGIVSRSPGDAKGYVSIPSDGVTEVGTYNVTSVTDTGTGDRTVVWNVDFSDTTYTCQHTLATDTGRAQFTYAGTFATGSTRLTIKSHDNNAGVHLADTLYDTESTCVAFGDQ